MALRAQVANLNNVLRKRSKPQHSMVQHQADEAPFEVLQARSDLHRVSCELRQLDESYAELQGRHAAECGAWHMEEERWMEEKSLADESLAAEQKAVETELAEVE